MAKAVGSSGVDVWYIDESSDASFVAMSAISVPLMRRNDGRLEIVWEDELKKALDFRRDLKKKHAVPMRKELHAVKLVGGRGRYLGGKRQFTKAGGARVFHYALSQLGFLQPYSIITVVGTRSTKLYGYTRLEAALYALFQRMQRASVANGRSGMVFFDEGHGEYRKLFRKALVHLPTGSMQGQWGPSSGLSKNVPMDKFFKDGNSKDSAHSLFIQIADLVAYAALMDVRGATLTTAQLGLGFGSSYKQIPVSALNTHASRMDPLGIVRL